MAAVDLGDLIELLEAEVNSPGTDSFPNATDDDWLNRLRNNFWYTVLDGIVSGYREDDGIVNPTDSDGEIDPTGTTFPRDMQQLVILYAGIDVITKQMKTLNTVFRAKAGPVEFETQQAATILTSVLNDLISRRNRVLYRLADTGVASPIYVDMVVARNESMGYEDMTWVGY